MRRSLLILAATVALVAAAPATASVTANSRNKRPTTPPIMSSGMNAAKSDTVIETIVKPTSFAPRSAA